MTSANEGLFTINLEGSLTKQKWAGKFKCKLRLSHRDSIMADNIRRQLLGSNANEANARADSLAFIAGQLAVRLLDSPDWWKASDNGMELEDDNIVKEIYDQCVMKENEAFDALHKKAEKAEKELVKAAEEIK